MRNKLNLSADKSLFHVLPNRGGKAKGFRKMTDRQLRESLMPHSWQFGWSSRWDTPVFHLNGTKRAVCEKTKEDLHLSYRTMCRQTQGGRLGISNSKSCSGKCDYCCQWDLTDKSFITRVYEELQTRLAVMQPDVHLLWQRFHDEHVLIEADVQYQSSPSYWKAFWSFFDTHIADMSNETANLCAAFRAAWFRAEGPESIIHGFNWHLQVWNNQEHAILDMIANPQPGVLYSVADFADSADDGQKFAWLRWWQRFGAKLRMSQVISSFLYFSCAGAELQLF